MEDWRRIWRALILMCIGVAVSVVRGAETNGFARPLRPFYIIGHGANTLSEAKAYLDSGANGLEIDVDIVPGHPNELCIAHGPDLGKGPGKTNSPPLAAFLEGLHTLARSHTNFCLVIYDCKRFTAWPQQGATLLEASRKYLVGSGDDRINVNAIISVGRVWERSIYSKIGGRLGPHEGVMVAGESNPAKVAVLFKSLDIKNQAYGDGVGFFSSCLAHFQIWFSVKKACQLRDDDHLIRFVVTWTINNPHLIAGFIKMGVDGILVDRKFHGYNFSWANLGNGLRSATRIVHDQGTVLGVRLANRNDNPFAIRNDSIGRQEDRR